MSAKNIGAAISDRPFIDGFFIFMNMAVTVYVIVDESLSLVTSRYNILFKNTYASLIYATQMAVMAWRQR